MDSNHLSPTHGSGVDPHGRWNVVAIALTLALGILGGGAPAAKSELVPPAVPGASADWWSQVRENSGREEYQAHANEAGRGFQAPNRAQGFRTYYRPEGVENGAHRELIGHGRPATAPAAA